jgi:3-oxoacyl-[acyl-carrier-protein] synthase-3
MAINSVITGTGSYIPTVVKKNSDFLTNQFLNDDGTPFGYENEIIIEKFKGLNGI